jgi:hypothetical protein
MTLQAILSKFTLTELRQLRIYLIEFQNCSGTAPSNQKKKSWMDAVVDLLTQINLSDNKGETDLINYVNKIMVTIRWLANHSFKFTTNMKKHIFKHIDYKLAYEVTETTIKLVDQTRAQHEILKCDMILPQQTLDYIQKYPSTLNTKYYYFLDDIERLNESIRQEEERIRQEVVLVEPRLSTYPIPEIFDPSSKEYNRFFEWDYYFYGPLPDFVTIREIQRQNNNVCRLTRLGQITHFITEDSNDENVTDETKILECKVCLNHKARMALSKCGHVFCGTCLIQLSDKKCPICRKEFMNAQIIRLYF